MICKEMHKTAVEKFAHGFQKGVKIQKNVGFFYEKISSPNEIYYK